MTEEAATCGGRDIRAQFTRSPSNTPEHPISSLRGLGQMPDQTTPDTRFDRTTPDVTEFVTHFLEIDRGRVHDDATARLAELIEAVELTAKGGELKILIKVEPRDPETFPDSGLWLEGEVTISKRPLLKRVPTTFHLAPGKGQITRRDPKQGQLY